MRGLEVRGNQCKPAQEGPHMLWFEQPQQPGAPCHLDRQVVHGALKIHACLVDGEQEEQRPARDCALHALPVVLGQGRVRVHLGVEQGPVAGQSRQCPVEHRIACRTATLLGLCTFPVECFAKNQSFDPCWWRKAVTVTGQLRHGRLLEDLQLGLGIGPQSVPPAQARVPLELGQVQGARGLAAAGLVPEERAPEEGDRGHAAVRVLHHEGEERVDEQRQDDQV
mmetsp:Transcript_51348/g.144697  ORF Transcript_51348/g.144697 Transcript_51348/m.144697 type:complete len:224 (-) Transcript_51348:2130-2801(-)